MPWAANASGIVSLDECRAAAISDRKTEWMVASGRWQYVYPRVLATFSGPVPYEAQLVAALKYAGTDAALSHATAGHDLGLCKRPAFIHVLVPYSREVEDQPGLKIHRSRRISATDRVCRNGVMQTSVDRTVIDLLEVRWNADGALGLIGDAIQSRLTTVEQLRANLVEARCAKWRRVVLEALPDVERGAYSALEIRDAKMRRRHGLPTGRRQVRRLADGTELLDVVVEECRTHVELDGRLGHNRTQERFRDMRRDNRSARAGLRHLRYGWADMFDRECEVAIEQAVIYRQEGWTAPFKRCASCPRTLPPGL